MKILITGSRNWKNEGLIEDFLLNLPSGVTIIHGGAPGVDSIAETKCKAIGVPTILIRPINPKIASYYLHRNAEMIGMCDEVVAFWDGESRGTKFTMDYAKARGKEVTIIKQEEQNE